VERGHGANYETREEVRRDIFDYIEGFYNCDLSVFSAGIYLSQTVRKKIFKRGFVRPTKWSKYLLYKNLTRSISNYLTHLENFIFLVSQIRRILFTAFALINPEKS